MADKDDLMTGAIVSFLLRAFVSDQSAFHANHFEITQTALELNPACRTESSKSLHLPYPNSF